MGNKGFNKQIKNRSELGFSIMEMMIAITIFLIVVGAVYGLLRIGNIQRSTINERSENIKNVRIAMNSIGREAVNAGLGYNRIGGTVPDDFTTTNFGLPPDPDKDLDLLTAVSTGNNINQTDYSKNDEKNDVVAFAFRDFEFNNGFPIVIKDVQEKDGALILKTPDGACANCQAYDLFLIETGAGQQAVILSTDIVGNNQIVLGNSDDALGVNYGKTKGLSKDDQKKVDDAQKKLTDAQEKLAKEQADLVKAQQELSAALARLDILNVILNLQKKVSDAQKKVTEAQQDVTAAQNALNATLAAVGSSGNAGTTSGSPVKKCATGTTSNCIDYTATTVTAKKIYLVSYSVAADGTLIRTTFGNNTGGTADQQIQKQPLAYGVRSFKINYLLSDGTTTNDPSDQNLEKEKCNEIVQLEVTIEVESELNQNGRNTPEVVTLTSTYSTRNLKYDNY